VPHTYRVQQQEWNTPDRVTWVATLDVAIRALDGPTILVAHSLGCATTAWWASRHGREAHAAKIVGALLVAPPDVERPDFPAAVTGFVPMPRLALPFRSIVAASSDDPWCASPRAQTWAADWGAEFHNIGPLGHINGESGLGDWAQGRHWLAQLAQD
jgi:uncharacterized protein